MSVPCPSAPVEEGGPVARISDRREGLPRCLCRARPLLWRKGGPSLTMRHTWEGGRFRVAALLTVLTMKHTLGLIVGVAIAGVWGG